MVTQVQTKMSYTPDEYLALEVASEVRHEYINGEMIPMAGGTPEHNEIASILNAILRINLRGKPYSIFIADQRLWIPARKLYTYPDVMVIQRPIQLQAGRKDTVINPILIAEVLSQTTKSYDKDEKFSAYRTIPSFQEYLLIDQYRQQIEHYAKSNFKQWIFTEYHHSEDRINLTSIGCEIVLGEIYDGIEFKTNSSES